MKNMYAKFLKLSELTGSLGAVVSTMGCAMCFPALASIASALGLGFLGQWEMAFLNTWLPFFAWFVLAINLLGWLAHKQLVRTLIMIIGPILLLLSYYPWFKYAWSTYVIYFALFLMVAVSIWDVFSKNNNRCDRTKPIATNPPNC